VLKHSAGWTCTNGFVAFFQLGFELWKLLDVSRKFAPEMPGVDRMRTPPKDPFDEEVDIQQHRCG
jgi:hypothetical protein